MVGKASISLPYCRIIAGSLGLHSCRVYSRHSSITGIVDTGYVGGAMKRNDWPNGVGSNVINGNECA